MGIRFKCPNGHSLHVKSFLAGKKGVCPDCGARMRIPTESDPSLEKGKDKDDDEKDVSETDANPAVPAAEFVPVPTAVPTAVPTSIPVPTIAPVPTAMPAPATAALVAPAAVSVQPVTAVPVSVAPVTAVVPASLPAAVAAVSAVPVTVAMPSMPPPRPTMMPGGPMPPGLIDPLAEAPHAVWYVRPAAGGQYGPARGDVLRQWMTEGRLAGDSLVWREGWADWKSAPDVFPELAGSAPSIVGPAVAVEGVSTARSGDYLARKRSNNSTAIAMMVLLGIVCVGLMIVLAYILTREGKLRSQRTSPIHAVRNG